jgi:sarcosine oxidase
MGSAIVAELAGRGARVLGLERHGVAHDRGSSHGGSRVIRSAYFEHPSYVPLLLRAYERWRDLEAATGADLLTETGGLMIGPETSRTVAGSKASAEAWGLAHELLDAKEVRSRWPSFTPGANDVALYERRAGLVRPERTVAAQIALARDRGAELHFDEPVNRWGRTAAGVEAVSRLGRYRAARLVLAAGAWAPQLLGDAGVPFVVERHVQFWLRAHPAIERFLPQRRPIFVWEDIGGTQAYGFPAIAGEDGVKVAFFRRGTVTSPDELRRAVAPDEASALVEYLRDKSPGLGPEVCAADPCMYTTTPDEHFVLGYLPGDEHVLLCSPCSGHGFKFVPVIGEVVADLLTEAGTRFDLSLFDPGRFGAAAGSAATSAPAR